VGLGGTPGVRRRRRPAEWWPRWYQRWPLHRYQADGATLKGPPADTTEATRVAWIPLSAVRDLLDRGQLDDGASITALLYLLAFAPISTAIKPAETVPEAGAT
jgi:hypothetical protein